MSYPDDSSALPEVDVDEAIALVASGTKLIDVREQNEWNAGHAPDALLIPLSELQQRLGKLSEGTRFLVICHSGGRSARATDYLVRGGFDAVNVAGGMMAWQAAGGDVIPGE